MPRSKSNNRKMKDILDEFEIKMLKTETANEMEALKQTEKIQEKFIKKTKKIRTRNKRNRI